MIKKNIVTVILATLLIVLASPGKIKAQTNTQTILLAKTKRLIAQKHFSGTITLVKNGQIIAQVANGYRNYSHKIKNTPKTNYMIGSVSKAITAQLIGILIKEGKLSLTTHLSTYYPNLKDANDVTIASVLNHRSGLIIGYFQPLNDYPSYQTYLAALTHHARINPRQIDKWHYSSYNYNLLAGIIPKLSHESYATFLRQNLTQPLKIKLALMQTPKPLNSYLYLKGHFISQDDYNVYDAYGAGQVATDGADLYHLLAAFLQGKVLGPKLTATMYHKPANAPFPYYSAGFYHLKNGAYHLHGTQLGAETSITISPDGQNAVIVQSNASSYTKGRTVNYTFDAPLYKLLLKS